MANLSGPARTEIVRKVIEGLLLLAVLLSFLASGGEFLLFGTPKNKVSCIAENHSEAIVDAKTATATERDNWTVLCQIHLDEKLIYGPKRLILPYPASFHEAMESIDFFRTKEAPKLIKEITK